MKSPCRANGLVATVWVENNKYFSNRYIECSKRTTKYPINRNSELSAYMTYQRYGYSNQALDYVELICYVRKIYVP